MGIDYRGPLNTGSAVGSDGSATASATSSKIIRGRVAAVHIAYVGSPPATTDVTIATEGTLRFGANTLITVSNNNTDGWYYPRHQVHSNAGVGLTLDGTRHATHAPPILDRVTVTIAGANSGDSATIYLLLEN